MKSRTGVVVGILGAAVALASWPGFAAAQTRQADSGAALVIEPSLENGFRVEVVDATTHAPVAGVLVTLVKEDESFQWGQALGLFEGDLVPLLPKLGKCWRTDADGTTGVPYPGFPPVTVLAHTASGDAWGERRLDHGESSPFVVAIAPAHRLVVEVVDATGKPAANAPVVVRSSEGIVTPWRRFTDANGRATFEPAAIHPSGRRANRPVHEPTVEISLAVLAREEQSIQLKSSEITAQPIRFVLPPCGRVELEFEDGDGHRCGEPMTAVVSDASRRLWSFEQQLTAPRNQSMLLHVDHGAAHIDWVEAGLRVDAGLPQAGASERVTSSEPIAAGQVTTLHLRCRPPRPEWRGRAVDEKGDPLVSADFLGFLPPCESPGQESQAVAITTTLPGSFSIDAEMASQRHGTIRLYTRDAAGQLERGATIEVGPERAGGGDLGDVIFKPLPPLVAGVVVDEAGGPIAGAEVVVCVLLAKDAEDEDAWPLEVDDLTALTDRAGRFEMRGVAPEGKCTIDVSEGRFRTEIVPYAPGTSHVRVVLHRYGSVAGSVLLAPGMDAARIEGRLSFRGDPTDEATIVETTDVKPDAGSQGEIPFAWKQVIPGIAHVKLVMFEFGRYEVLLDAPDVEVRTGEVMRDPRLQRVDLRDRLLSTRIDFYDEAGEPIERGEVCSKYLEPPRVQNTRFASWPIDDGHLEIVTVRPLPELEALAAGFRPQWFQASGKATRVVMRSGIPLRIELDPSAPLLNEEFVVECSPQRKVSGMRPVSRVADDFTRSAEDEDEHRWKLAPGHPLHFQISEPGSHVLWVDLHRNTEKEGPRNATLVKDGLDFTITEPANAGEEQVVRVTCTNEMVQAALRELDGR